MSGYCIPQHARGRRIWSGPALLAAACILLVAAASAQETAKVTFDSSETVFTVLAAINHCGYDQDLSISDPVRSQVRAEITKAVAASPMAQATSSEMCAFYRDHLQPDASRTLAQYISLALNMGDAPEFRLKVKEADLPPDAAYVLGFAPLVQRFYRAAGLAGTWERQREVYQGYVDRYHVPVSNLLLSTDAYLRMPISGYLGRSFAVVVEPLAAPGQVNSRNYGADYYMVISPERGALKLDLIRHTYLHFVLDPLMAKRDTMLKRLQPLLALVQSAPLEESHKSDIGLLVTESLIRAVEARSASSPKERDSREAEARRKEALDSAVTSGFILAPYFNGVLAKFEQGQEGLREILPDWLFFIDVGAERKRAEQVVFASQAVPELMTATPGRRNLLDIAEQRMGAGDYTGARKLAQQALDERQGDAGRALFLLAQSASLNRDAEGARGYFQRVLEASRDPRILSWTHIYLGRMADMQEERETAIQHYQAALAAGDDRPETRAAAERGLQKPYEPQRTRE